MPRKSEVSAVAAAPPTAMADTTNDSGKEGEMGLDGSGMVKEGSAGREKERERESLGGGGVNVEDLNLPKSIVTRLAKGVLPPNTQIQGNAMLAMAKSATVFVNYLASHANEHTVAQNRKTISPQDVFRALEDIEFSEFRARLEAELARYNEVQTDKRNTYRKKVADKAAVLTGNETLAESELEGNTNGQQRDGQPAAKKARREPGGHGTRDGVGELHEEENMGEGEDEEGEDDDAGEEDEQEGDGDEDGEGEDEKEDEQIDEMEHEHEGREVEDEALDNGEDSE